MENNAVKRDNRKALPKYLLILFVAAIFGGVMGFAAGWVGHDQISEVIAAAVANVLTIAAPWALLATSMVSLAVVLWLYQGAKRLFHGWDGEEETVMDQADERLNWALMLITVQIILNMFFFAAAVCGQSPWGGIAGVVFFLASMFLLVVAQQKIVDLARQMNPEKQGSIYDVKFKKKWIESCDEAERKQIGQAAYQAFGVLNTACPILWLVLIILNFAFNCGILLPAFAVSLLWLIPDAAYFLACIRLGRRKG